MDKPVTLDEALRLLKQLGPTGHDVLSRATIATLAVAERKATRQRKLPWYDFWSVQTEPVVEPGLFLASVNEPALELPRESFPVAKIGYFKTVQENKSGPNIGIEHVLVKHRPGWSLSLEETLRDFSYELMAGGFGDAFFTNVVDDSCSAISMFSTADNGKSWRKDDARWSISDFLIGMGGDIAVASNGFASFISARNLRNKIATNMSAIEPGQGIPFKVGDHLTRIRDVGRDEGRLAIYSSVEREAVIYNDMMEKVRRAEMPNFVASSIEDNGKLFEVERGTPVHAVHRVRTGSRSLDEFVKTDEVM